MGLAYSHFLIDWDHTIWDFERCSRETLNEMHIRFALQGMTADEFYEVFSAINHELWIHLGQGRINKNQLREIRLERTFKHFNQGIPSFHEEFNQYYIQECPKKNYLMPGVTEVLMWLKELGAELWIFTNGFEEVQKVKVSHSGIAEYFNGIITSNQTGYNKPERIMFYRALEIIKSLPERTLVIGDTLETDIVGALNIGLDCIYYNPTAKRHNSTGFSEIKHWNELPGLIKKNPLQTN